MREKLFERRKKLRTTEKNRKGKDVYSEEWEVVQLKARELMRERVRAEQDAPAQEENIGSQPQHELL